MDDREIAEIEAVMRKHAPQTWISGQQFRRLNDDAIALIAVELSALRSKDREDGARPDIVEALKREAREHAFRRDLAEASYASLKERVCRAARRSFAGDDHPLRRLVNSIESPTPIIGSAALTAQSGREGRDG